MEITQQIIELKEALENEKNAMLAQSENPTPTGRQTLMKKKTKPKEDKQCCS